MTDARAGSEADARAAGETDALAADVAITRAEGRAGAGAADVARMLASGGGTARVPLAGGSMRPLLEDGDIVRVRLGEPPRVGDVVVAWTAGGLLIHRCIGRVRDGRVLLRGDNAPRADEPVPPGDVLGRATAVEGTRGRRFDGPGLRVAGWAAAMLARWQRVAMAPARPRPAAIMRAVLAVERRLFPPMAPEEALLLVAVHPEPDSATLARARALIAGPIDWGRFAERAYRGQLGPLAWHGLALLAREHGLPIPDDAIARLKGQAAANAARWEETAGILDDLLVRLAAEGIPMLAHKGVALALTVYPDPALRVAGDLDLSVRDADRARAEAVVADVRDPLVAANPDRRGLAGHHVELDGTAHHDVEPSLFGGGRWAAGRLDWDGIWRRAEAVDAIGHPLLVPAPTDLVLTLVANAVRRGFSPPRLIVDVAHAIHSGGERIDWSAFASEARRTRLDHRSWIALGLARDWCGAAVPGALLEPPADLRMAGWEQLALRAKHQQPFLRLPTRVLWAGSAPAAVRQAVRLVAGRSRRAVRHYPAPSSP